MSKVVRHAWEVRGPDASQLFACAIALCTGAGSRTTSAAAENNAGPMSDPEFAPLTSFLEKVPQFQELSLSEPETVVSLGG